MESILGQPLGPFSHTGSTLAALAVAATRPEWPSLDAIDVPLHQRLLSHAIDEAIHHHLLSTASDTCSRALALSFGLPHVGDWLNVVPSASLGLHLHDREFCCCLRYWLGFPLHRSAYSHRECHGMADHFRNHQVGCGGNGDRIVRHNAICDVLFSAAQYATRAPMKEAPSLVPSCYSRLADILLPH